MSLLGSVHSLALISKCAQLKRKAKKRAEPKALLRALLLLSMLFILETMAVVVFGTWIVDADVDDGMRNKGLLESR